MARLLDMLAELQYRPRQGVVETKQLRSQYAGIPQMQQQQQAAPKK